jgi:hypothetical protein
MKKILYIVLLVVMFVGGFYTGWKFAQPSAQEKIVTADVILTSLHDRGFLVSQTYMFSEPVTIKVTEGSVWKDFLFGQTIDARGTMEVNMGVDLKKVEAKDVEITSQKVIVTLPPSEIFNTRLVGDVDVENKQGIIKRLLDNDDGYNQALTELTEQAEAAAKKTELLKTADEKAVEEVARLLQLVVENKTVEVKIGVNQ